MSLFHTQCYFSREGRGRWREKTGVKAGGFFAVLPTYVYPLLSFLPFLLPSLPPSPSVLKKSFPFMLCERTRWEKLQGLCSRSPWQPQGIPVVGTGGTAEFPRPPGEGRQRKRGGRGAGASSVWSREQQWNERGTYISRGTMGVLLADCEKTHWGHNALWYMKALGSFPEPHSAPRSLVNILKCKENNPSFSRVLKTDFKYYFRQLLLVCWKLLQFAEFPLIAVGGETAQQVLSKGSQRWALAFVHTQACIPLLSAIPATSSYSPRREELLFPMSKK